MDAAELPQARRDRYAACGSIAWVFRHASEPGRVAVRASYCHDRFCLPCQQQRARLLAEAVHKALPDGYLRFLTLTTRAYGSSLKDRLDHLYASFRRLRDSAGWRSHVEGGVAFCEVKWSTSSDDWHPHLHVLVVGDYYPVAELRASWVLATGGSHVVDIRAVSDRAEAARYVTTYASKPLSYAASNRAGVTAEALQALRGRRLVTTFGNLRGVRVSDADEIEGEWLPIGPLWLYIARAAQGDPDAAAILAALKGDEAWQQTNSYSGPSPPPPS